MTYINDCILKIISYFCLPLLSVITMCILFLFGFMPISYQQEVTLNLIEIVNLSMDTLTLDLIRMLGVMLASLMLFIANLILYCMNEDIGLFEDIVTPILMLLITTPVIVFSPIASLSDSSVWENTITPYLLVIVSGIAAMATIATLVMDYKRREKRRCLMTM